MMISYLRRLIRENRKYRRDLADAYGLIHELSTALNKSTARNLMLCTELSKTTAALKLQTNAMYGKNR